MEVITFETKVDIQGRITIPSKIRKRLGIKRDDHVRVEGLTKLVLVEEKNPGKEAPT